MQNQPPTPKSRRALAALIVLCYLWVSAVISFQHCDCLLSEAGPGMQAVLLNAPVPAEAGAAPTSAAFVIVSAPSSTDAAPHVQLTACRHAAPAPHCLACDWLTMQVSPALSTFALAHVGPSTSDCYAFRSLCLRRQPERAASRAPPCA